MKAGYLMSHKHHKPEKKFKTKYAQSCKIHKDIYSLCGKNDEQNL